jgi:nucleosome assembly protein 1-like 1
MINIDCSSSSLWSNCRPDIQRRINALLNNQAEYFRLRVEFYRQLQDLQYAYNSQFERILERRRQIIDGSCEPTEVEKEIHWSESDLTPSISQEMKQTKKGLPNFWLIVLKNLDSYDYPIQSRDELCLKYLTDIRCILNPPNSDSTSFTLQFQFQPSNPFFSQTILTKHYSIRLELDDSNPYRSYDGPEVDRCHGCLITWQPDHNLTIRKRNKRLRNKTTKQIRFVQIEEPIKSFFNFFSPPIIPDEGIHQMTDEDQIHLEADIEFGLLLKQRVLPRSILYYTGEVLPIFNPDEDELTSSDSSQ